MQLVPWVHRASAVTAEGRRRYENVSPRGSSCDGELMGEALWLGYNGATPVT